MVDNLWAITIVVRPLRACYKINIHFFVKLIKQTGGPWTLDRSHESLSGWHLWTQGYNLNKLGRGLLGDDTYQISKFYAFWFQTRRLFMFSYLAYVNYVTPGAGPVLAPGA